MLFSTACSSAQEKGFELNSAKKQVVKFKLINNLILIPVTVNGVDLTFLLDSGVVETILFSLEDKEVNFDNVEKVQFSGLGENVELFGLKSTGNTLKIGKNLKDDSHNIYLILNEDFNFSSHVGIPVNGIIGYHFFKNHPVEINYSTKKITVYGDETTFVRRSKRSAENDIMLEGNKPYFMASVNSKNKAQESKLLLDLGNSDAIWLFPKLIENFVYNRPNIQDYLGRGFNGDIFGKRSRIKEISLGKFTFEKPLTAMPDEVSIQHLNIAADRKGSIGNDILRRFNIIFDYPNEKLYLKKNKYFSDPFHFNMSGLDIKHDGANWEEDLVQIKIPSNGNSSAEVQIFNSNSNFKYKFTLKPVYSIAGVRADSPAYIAGLRKDDIILKINNKKASTLTLQNIMNLLKSSEGKAISMEIQRNFEILNFKFQLKDPIPYEEN